MNTQVNPTFDNSVDQKDFKFRFKKDNLGNQRPTVEVKGFVPSVEGIVGILEKGGKGLELLQDAMYDVVRGALGSYVADNENASQDSIPWEKFTWESIANAPREDRRSIPEEQWKGFAEDYLKVMPGVTGKSPEAIANATTVYLKKFTLVKTNKPILAKLKEQLSLYVEHSPKAEEFSDVLEVLLKKADAYLKADDAAAILENL
jgi:hypothetical protein